MATIARIIIPEFPANLTLMPGFPGNPPRVPGQHGFRMLRLKHAISLVVLTLVVLSVFPASLEAILKSVMLGTMDKTNKNVKHDRSIIDIHHIVVTAGLI